MTFSISGKVTRAVLQRHVEDLSTHALRALYTRVTQRSKLMTLPTPILEYIFAFHDAHTFTDHACVNHVFHALAMTCPQISIPCNLNKRRNLGSRKHFTYASVNPWYLEPLLRRVRVDSLALQNESLARPQRSFSDPRLPFERAAAHVLHTAIDMDRVHTLSLTSDVLRQDGPRSFESLFHESLPHVHALSFNVLAAGFDTALACCTNLQRVNVHMTVTEPKYFTTILNVPTLTELRLSTWDTCIPLLVNAIVGGKAPLIHLDLGLSSVMTVGFSDILRLPPKLQCFVHATCFVNSLSEPTLGLVAFIERHSMVQRLNLTLRVANVVEFCDGLSYGHIHELSTIFARHAFQRMTTLARMKVSNTAHLHQVNVMKLTHLALEIDRLKPDDWLLIERAKNLEALDLQTYKESCFPAKGRGYAAPWRRRKPFSAGMFPRLRSFAWQATRVEYLHACSPIDTASWYDLLFCATLTHVTISNIALHKWLSESTCAAFCPLIVCKMHAVDSWLDEDSFDAKRVRTRTGL